MKIFMWYVEDTGDVLFQITLNTYDFMACDIW